MVEENRANENTENANNSQKNVASRDLRGVFIAAICALIFLVLVAKFWPNLPQRMAFFTGNLFNLIIAFAVIAQVVIYRKQWAVMKWQISSSEKNSIWANRAYVVARIKDTGPYDEGFQFRLIIENGGNTPANNVCVNYWCHFGEPPWRMQPIEEIPPNTPVKQVVFETTKAGTTERLGVIGPRGSYVFTTMPPILVDMSIGTDASQRFDSGQYRFYCWGTILYEDMFKKTRESHFCFSLWRKASNGYLSFEQIETGYPCEHGNYAS